MNKVAAFYQFLALADPQKVRDEFFLVCEAAGLHGTILVSPEGVNGTLAGRPAAIDAFIETLRQKTIARPAFENLELKVSTAGAEHFDRLKIRVKPEIITFGQRLDVSHQTGAHVAPQNWNELLAAPDVTIIDTRNRFEVARGSFENAIDPGLTSFSQFKDFVTGPLGSAKSRKIALFCTGGIRCEKASAYMIEQGFQSIYQLHGGILRYLENVPAAQSKWRGDCFVFDQRIALGHGLTLKTSNGHANLLDTTPRNIAE